MTAEIAVMNKSAVALAADSKVTIGGGGGKTFDTVNKVFTLSKVHPVGIMVFGNAEFMNYPWETIIKLYRSDKCLRNEPTILDWAEDFIKFLRKFGNIRPDDRDVNLYGALSSWFAEIRRNVQKEARAQGFRIPSSEYTKLLRETYESLSEQYISGATYFSKREFGNFIKKYSNVIIEVIDENYGGFEDEALTKAVTKFALAALQTKSYSPQSSGIVIAGFGREEMFPTLTHYETDGYIGANIKISQTKHVDITRDMSSSLHPFAQKDMVQRFMNGIDPEYSMFLQQMYGNSLIDNCLKVLDKFGATENKNEDVRNQIRKAAIDSLRDSHKASKDFQQEHFSDPIVEMIALLPKDELPNLAESLVALTSLKRHVSHDLETVGGPIDVALISKSDGFVWIKRKHYFKPELNPQFASNYMRDVAAGGNDAGFSRALSNINRQNGRVTGRKQNP